MKRMICILLTVLLLLPLSGVSHGAEFDLDPYAVIPGMEFSWYQGYEPVIRYNIMTLYLPVRSATCVGDITASIDLEDPNVHLLAETPQAVTVSSKDGIYPVKLQLQLASNRRCGDYPARITLKGTDDSGKERLETIPYVIRIRDGRPSHETLEPVITDVAGSLVVGTDGSLGLCVSNPTTTLSITDAWVTVTDRDGQLRMASSHRLRIGEVLPGQTVSLEVPLIVPGNASISRHSLEVILNYKVLERDAQWKETVQVPVTQEIRLEQGGVQLPEPVAGELGNMALTLMNMGKGTLTNVLVKLEVPDLVDAQCVLVGTMAPGETKLARLTYTPDTPGSYSALVTITCEDAYGNAHTQTLEAPLTVAEPIPETELMEEQEEKKTGLNPVSVVLCVLLAAALILQGWLLRRKLHRLEEERL